MVENNNAGPGSGDQGGTHEQHVEAGRQGHKNGAGHQSDSSPDQQSDSSPGTSPQSGRQPTPVQQPDTRLNESQQAGSLSAAEVQGGTPEQRAAAGRQSQTNEAKR